VSDVRESPQAVQKKRGKGIRTKMDMIQIGNVVGKGEGGTELRLKNLDHNKGL